MNPMLIFNICFIVGSANIQQYPQNAAQISNIIYSQAIFYYTTAMPHSRIKRRCIDSRLRRINKRIKSLRKLHLKQLQSAQIITLSHVSLGELRAKFSLQHKALPQYVLSSVNHFRRILSDSQRSVFIYGSDQGLLACRIPLNDSTILDSLTTSLRLLPSHTNHKFRGIDRGSYSTRHYCVWSPYSKQPFISRELKEDGQAGLDFLEANQRLWQRISDILAQISPCTYRRFLRYPLPNKLKRFCTAFAGCVVNLGDKDPVQTKPHRDVKESIYGFSCVVPAGDYTGGGVILYDLKLVVDLRPGEVLFFPDSLIHHANEEVVGDRSSIVAFTQENLFHYWKRKFKFVNNNELSKF